MDDPDSDYHNFSQLPSSNHRLPTLNGVEALLDVVEKHQPISTNLANLDSILGESGADISQHGGVPCGGVTEVYGAPGSGKTHFAMQLTANTLRQNHVSRAVWIDTATHFPSSRLDEMLTGPMQVEPMDENATPDDASITNGGETEEQVSALERLTHYYITSLTHLLAVFLTPSRDIIPEGTKLLVIDDFSGIVMNGLPQDERVPTSEAVSARQSLSHENIVSKSIALRRAAMLSSISACLARLAATRNMAIVVLSKATSNRKSGTKIATMRSILNSSQWNDDVAVRIGIYRMFWPKIDRSVLTTKAARKRQRQKQRHALRVVMVERVGKKDVQADGVRFVILADRLQAVDPPRAIDVHDVVLLSSPPAQTQENEEAMGNLGLEDAREDEDQSLQMPEDMPASSMQPVSQASKRKVSEIADSEDEDELEADVDLGKSSKMKFTTGFLPSSQVSVGEDTTTTIKQTTSEAQSIVHHDGDDSDEMLLKD